MKAFQSTVLPTSKVSSRHLDRVAVVYVRQSSLRQVTQHQESTKLQYGLTERAVALGWPREQVVIVDEDQGRSAASALGRPGFQRLVADVGLGRVGIVLGVDMSRLARSCMDWYQLLEVCGLFHTLIADLDGLYDPAVYNDRLLLGLKGTMSEAELHTIRQRLYSGKRAKAERGEMAQRLPMGYVRRPSGEVVKDPDERARLVIAMVFDAFHRTETVYGTVRYLVQQGIELPVRLTHGPSKGELNWRTPNAATVRNLLHNPAYAGAYSWGRRPTDPRRKQAGKPGTGRTSPPPPQWAVCLQDHLPAYISWEQYQANLATMQRNCPQIHGIARQGPSLLAGLLRCGKCGKRMAVQYSGLQGRLRYVCAHEWRSHFGPVCQTLCGADLDRLVEDLVLQAVEPAALHVSLQVAADLDREQQQLHRHWRQRLEQADYQVERAKRQYSAVEPENRLVARQLERDWEEALHARGQLQQQYESFQQEQPAALTGGQRTAIQDLALNIPAIWHAPTTQPVDRKRIIGLLIDHVTVAVVGVSEQVDVVVHWQGGHQTAARLRRPMRYAKNLSDRQALTARMLELQAHGQTLAQIVETLDKEGHRAARGGPLTTANVHHSLRTQGLTRKQRPKSRHAHDQQPEEVPLREAAQRIGMPFTTLRNWISTGKARGRIAREHGHTLVLVWLDEAELLRLQRQHQAPAKGKAAPLRVEEP